MKVILSVSFGLLVYSGLSLAGGSIGGGGGSIELEAPGMDSLMRVYVDGAEYRRFNARLSVDGVQTLSVIVGDDSLELRKSRGRIVDVGLSKELLPTEIR